MDPYHNRRQQTPNAHLRDIRSDNSGPDETPDNPGRPAGDSGDPPAADRQPQYSDGFTLIPPNQSRRSKMQMMAQKEEEDLQRWKEAHRVTSVHVNPERLGGNVTLAEAREKQLASLRCSKLQKKLKQEEDARRRKQEEEEEFEKKKAEQRAKAERLQERRQREEQRRREQLQQDRLRSAGILQRHTHVIHGLREDAGTNSERRKKDVQLEHQRVNSAWLDKLESRARGSESEGAWEQEASEDSRHRTSPTTGQHAPVARPKPDPEVSWTEDIDMEPDFDWALMKLMNHFPDFSKVFLEEILDQCDGDCDQARMLLLS
ncbi:hypothetical protein Q5P01_014083 [Channa striata]|uniref:CUE domain-containing protein n=1 Tax=Channa striata TaxID=64152 RepID=A0AA88SJT4_CHASR|nr:hypothetical protein Q5P01_014083 [Channa striata]